MAPWQEPARPDRITIRPPQFGIGTLLAALAAFGVTFGVLNWLGMTEQTGYFVLAVIVVATVATAGLVFSLLQAYAASSPEEPPRPAVGDSRTGPDPFTKESG